MTPRIQRWQRVFEREISDRLDSNDCSLATLKEAMRYAGLAGGKRMRPLLVYASGESLGTDPDQLHGIACAVEVIHTYSLIHDDLPAMDDDDLRRGRASCHKAFDEATAILAGDALQALAFEILATDANLSTNPEGQLSIIASIASACGASGMAVGQALDLAAIDQHITLGELEIMHRLKTGALIRVSATAPAQFASAGPELCDKLARYGDCVGLAFQIHDDILDVTASSQQTGKPARADAARNKPAFPTVIGIDASKARAAELCRMAVDELEGFPGDTSVLHWLAAFAINRES